jgi:hypothetical protein
MTSYFGLSRKTAFVKSFVSFNELQQTGLLNKIEIKLACEEMEFFL